ncbi:MAG: hypothetical protein NVSMB18_28890 [Acetobacteraceae bacterium]
MRTDDQPLRREMRGSQPVEPELVGVPQDQADDQRRRVARWLELTRTILPGLAAGHGWPIRFDHCFMRVMLDNAVGGVWHHSIPRPAIRHLAAAQLDAAIALAEAVLHDPALLPDLNRRSLAWRKTPPR